MAPIMKLSSLFFFSLFLSCPNYHYFDILSLSYDRQLYHYFVQFCQLYDSNVLIIVLDCLDLISLQLSCHFHFIDF